MADQIVHLPDGTTRRFPLGTRPDEIEATLQADDARAARTVSPVSQDEPDTYAGGFWKGLKDYEK